MSKRNPWVSGVFNLITPGLGYFYCGKFTLGIIVALLTPFLYILTDFISIVLPSKINYLFYFSSHCLIHLVFLIHGIAIAKQNKQYILKTKNLVSIYIVFFLTAFSFKSIVCNTNFEAYKLENKYMQNTIMQDENILIRLNAYKIYNPFSPKKEIFHISVPNRNDVVQYISPFLDKNNNITRDLIINRIIAIPGDTIKIVDKICYINGKKQENKDTYFFNNFTLDTNYQYSAIYPNGAKWNKDQYGPLYIPKANDIIQLNNSNIFIWEEVIAMENDLSMINANEFFAEILAKGEYKIQKNYYFLMGDNRNNSTDSRITGLTPEEEIRGKAEFVIGNFSDLLSLFTNNSRAGIKIE